MSVVFFTDRDLGLQFPTILRNAGLHVERHADHFPPDCADETWLREVSTREWVAVTHDARIRYKPNELAAIVSHKVILLVVVGHAPYADLARSFVATVPRILTFVSAQPPPVIGKVYRPSPADLSKNLRPPAESRSGTPNRRGRVRGGCPEDYPLTTGVDGHRFLPDDRKTVGDRIGVHELL